ncbi:MAG: SDR family NAD(P)-dependent oxidoreductase, partial [Actinobacteria bacterium]|nr:SDR family NAD(P)-dependent oxidoreductase [Actinomycetota bacterium]
MNSGTLDGQVVVVTGGGSGMGASFARRLSSDGARLVINDVNEVAAGQVASEVGGEASIFDVTDSAAFNAAIDRIAEHYGRLDVLINNAGIAPTGDAHKREISMANQIKRIEGRYDELTPTDSTVDLSDDEWDRMIKIHLYGTF